MKILILSHYFQAHRGGVERVAGRLAEELAALGCEVRWLATGDEGAEATRPTLQRQSLAATNLVEETLGLPYPLLAPQAFAAISAAVRECDVVLAHDALYMTSVIGFLASRVYRKPFVVVQHIGLVPYRNPLLAALMRAANRLLVQPLLARADQVVFISDTTRRHFASLDFKRRPLVIFNGVDASVFTPAKDEAEIAAVRRRLKLPTDVPVALFVGRFVEKKGLAIIERLARARPEILFVFAGWGALDPSQWGLPNARVFSALSGASLAPLYRSADLLLLPSVGEGFPLVVQEAMACGLSVLCGAETAAADPEAEALLVGVEIGPDLDETARAFGKALTAEVAASRDAAARARRAAFAARRYAWGAVALDYRELLGDVLQRSRHCVSRARESEVR